MIVTFCGHRELQFEEDLRIWLEYTIEKLINSGANLFFLGGYGAFDEMTAEIVWTMKKQYPYIKTILVLPYAKKQFDGSKYDGVLYPNLEGVSDRYAIIHRNRWMVDSADVVVAYVDHNYGGAYKTLEYAESKKKIITQYEMKYK